MANALSVAADSTNVADASMAGGGINVIDVSSASSQAHVLGETQVFVDEGAAVNAGSLTTHAESSNDADAHLIFGGIEGISVDIADVQATTNHDTIARLGPVDSTAPDGAASGSLNVSSGGVNFEAVSHSDAPSASSRRRGFRHRHRNHSTGLRHSRNDARLLGRRVLHEYRPLGDGDLCERSQFRRRERRGHGHQRHGRPRHGLDRSSHRSLRC